MRSTLGAGLEKLRPLSDESVDDNTCEDRKNEMFDEFMVLHFYVCSNFTMCSPITW